jgi:hypothetical protein
MSQDPEFPPVDDSQARAAEGTDFDEALKKAQEASRLNTAFDLKPGKLPTSEQITSMVDFQTAVNGHQDRVAERNVAESNGDAYYANGESESDPQMLDMDRLVGLFLNRRCTKRYNLKNICI